MSAFEVTTDMFHSPDLADTAALSFRLDLSRVPEFSCGRRRLGLAVGTSSVPRSRILKKNSRPHGLDQRRSLPNFGVATLPLPPCGRLPSPPEHGGRLRALDLPTPVGPAPFFCSKCTNGFNAAGLEHFSAHPLQRPPLCYSSKLAPARTGLSLGSVVNR